MFFGSMTAGMPVGDADDAVEPTVPDDVEVVVLPPVDVFLPASSDRTATTATAITRATATKSRVRRVAWLIDLGSGPTGEGRRDRSARQREAVDRTRRRTSTSRSSSNPSCAAPSSPPVAGRVVLVPAPAAAPEAIDVPSTEAPTPDRTSVYGTYVGSVSTSPPTDIHVAARAVAPTDGFDQSQTPSGNT